MVPMMKRKQHELAQNAYETQLSELGKIDPLEYHSKEARDIKEALRARIDAQASELAAKGFNVNTNNDVFRTNREVQDQFSPTGRLGKINASKVVYKKNYDDFIKNLVDNKVPLSRAKEVWDKKLADQGYSGYDENDDITDVPTQGVPTYQDFEKDLSINHSLLGSTSKSMAASGFDIVRHPSTGMWVSKQERGNHIFKDNLAQINASELAMKNKWIDKGGTGTEWSEVAGMDHENIKNRIENTYDSMKITVDENNRYVDTNVLSGQGGEETPVSGKIINNESTLKSDALEHETYTSANDRYKFLKNQPTRSSEENSELEDLEELRAIADEKLKNNSAYKDLDGKVNTELNKWKDVSKKFDLTSEEKEIVKNNPNLLPQILFEKGISAYKGNKNDPELKMVTSGDQSSNFYNLLEKRQKIKNEAWKQSSSTRHAYSYVPTTTKEVSEDNIYQNNVLSVLSGLNDIGQALDLKSISTSGGVKKNIEDIDVENIGLALKNTKEGNFKIQNIKVYGDQKVPEITATFTPAKTFEGSDMDRGLFQRGANSSYGGEEKPITVTFRLKKYTNAPDTGSATGFENLTGLIADYYKDKGEVNKLTGDFQGTEVSYGLIQSTYSELTNAELAQRYLKDKAAQTALELRALKKGVNPDTLLKKYPNNKQ